MHRPLDSMRRSNPVEQAQNLGLDILAGIRLVSTNADTIGVWHVNEELTLSLTKAHEKLGIDGRRRRDFKFSKIVRVAHLRMPV